MSALPAHAARTSSGAVPARALAKYRAVIGVTAQSALAYPLETFSRCGFMAVLIFVFIQLWRATFALSGRHDAGGNDLGRIVWYLVFTETVVLSAPRTFDKIDQEVKSGDLAYQLTRPYIYTLFHAAQYLGGVLVVLPANLIVGGAIAWIAVGPPPFGAAIAPALATAITLALLLNFASELMIGLLAFWFEDTFAFYWIYQKLTFTLGGLFLPLTLFPGWLRRVAELLPFAAITYAPARLVAHAGVATAASTVGVQSLWLALFALAAVALYRRGVRRLNANGG
jgi:ABC-2 type transport system permease protein